MSLWKVLLIVLALICTLHATAVHGGDRGLSVGYPAPRPNPYLSKGCRSAYNCPPELLGS
ncbi:hypothetical protein E2562_022802 [Oryza meyeriana var. granulata]|uniref:Uncharacterized protein n=1 Tax=Oryza meyeriana var. granulata TaxID=110450 RepID=A0A6G1EYA1_9ORYZ|nr:hypothetical protein E2562_022802 [Oryza meyeriana var. granulata]